MNYRLLAMIIGQISLIVGALMCIPLFISVGYQEDTKVMAAFGIAIGISLFIGIVGLLLSPKKDKRDMRSSSGFAMCGLIWIVVGLLSAIPYRISGVTTNYMDALFETVSGYTTTGASILRTVEDVPKSLLFWRALTQFLGGMGVLVFVIAILPRNDKMSTALAKAEVPGPQFGKLVGKLRNTSIILYAMYIVLTLILFGVLCAQGMPAFDSICHAFSTASTGGFSVKNASIAAYNSVGIEVTITIFMALFSINFNVCFMLLIGKAIKALKNEEMISMFIIMIVAMAILTISLTVSKTYSSIGEALRYASFNVSSIMSTTGFGTADFTAWPILCKVTLLTLMFIGGCAGSTAGGLKVSRSIVLFKTSYQDMRRLISPRSVYTVKMDGKPLDQNTILNIRSFFFIYAMLMVASILLISIENHGYANDQIFETNLSAVITCFNNVGPGMGGVGPKGNFADYSLFAKFILIMDMWLGRLELMPILLLFHVRSWKRIKQN